jgi:hypothetical protein
MQRCGTGLWVSMDAERDRHGNDDCEHYHAAMGQL